MAWTRQSGAVLAVQQIVEAFLPKLVHKITLASSTEALAGVCFLSIASHDGLRVAQKRCMKELVVVSLAVISDQLDRGNLHDTTRTCVRKYGDHLDLLLSNLLTPFMS